MDLKRLQLELTENQWDLSQEDSDLLTQCMWQAVQNGAAAVVAVGGDGTLNKVIAL
jgi:diacylglycerol kinase family enzyme